MKIVLLSHGNFCYGLLDTIQMIAGEQKDIEAVGLKPGESDTAYLERVEKAIKPAIDSNENVVVFTDLISGTPFNVTIQLMKKYNIHHFSGISVPILLEFVMSKEFVPFEDLLTQIEEVSKTSFLNVNKYIEQALENIGDDDD